MRGQRFNQVSERVVMEGLAILTLLALAFTTGCTARLQTASKPISTSPGTGSPITGGDPATTPPGSGSPSAPSLACDKVSHSTGKVIRVGTTDQCECFGTHAWNGSKGKCLITARALENLDL